MTNTTNTTPTSGAADLLAMVSKALRDAYNLGQRYRQQADSEYISLHRKAVATRAKFLVLVEETCATLAAGQATAAQATPAYKDSTPELHIGDSAFESWYSTYSPAHKSDKQRARDAYAAGMGDPLVTAAPQPAPVQDCPPLPDFDTVEQHIYGACRRYITQDMLEPIHNLIRETVDADRAARAPADSVLEDAARLTTEQEYAIRQGHEIAASEAYFGARSKLDTNRNHNIFTAGFERGWDAARKQGGA